MRTLQVNYTRRGLAFSDDWGSLRNAANVAMLAFLVAQPLPASEARPYECWALSQLRWVPHIMFMRLTTLSVSACLLNFWWLALWGAQANTPGAQELH